MSKSIAILCHGQAGDVMTITSVFKYREELWGDAKITWFIAPENYDLLKFQNIEVRPFPRGFGYAERTIEENKKLIDAGKEPTWEDWQPLVDENNHLNIELAKAYPSLAEFDKGYWPAPHQIDVKKRHGLSYPECSKKVFGIPDHYEWHPYLLFSDEERRKAKEFIERMGSGKKIVIETFAGSSQSLLQEDMVFKAMAICNERWGDCHFIFASHKFIRLQENFPNALRGLPNVHFASHFTVRQCALIADLSDLMISVSSGITVAASAWGIRQPVTIQFCGSQVCSTVALNHAPRFELITADFKNFGEAKQEFYGKLTELLNEYK